MRPARDPKTKAEEYKRARQRCLCNHPRRSHLYFVVQPGQPQKARPCAVPHCTCKSFLLLQRSIL